MMKYMAVLLMAGLVCGCDKTTSPDVKPTEKSFVPSARPLVGNSFDSSTKPPVKAQAVVSGAKSPKAMAEEKAVALATSKANVEKAKVVWQSDSKNAAKRAAYDSAVADLMGKTGK